RHPRPRRSVPGRWGDHPKSRAPIERKARARSGSAHRKTAAGKDLSTARHWRASGTSELHPEGYSDDEVVLAPASKLTSEYVHSSLHPDTYLPGPLLAHVSWRLWWKRQSVRLCLAGCVPYASDSSRGRAQGRRNSKEGAHP